MKYLFQICSFLVISICLIGCGQNEHTETKEVNPAAAGFNLENSDAQAIAVADEVMLAMGGREAWDNTRYVCWKFFGRDALIWDKWENRVRIDWANGVTGMADVNTGKGRFYANGVEFTAPDTVAYYEKRAKGTWINHSYWLVMPFKLKDSGVTLKYLGSDTTQLGDMADKLLLTFEEVGVSPDNKYEIWVDKYSRLVTQWAHYSKAEDAEPRFVMPWQEYKKHGEILLSSSRGERGMEEIMVFDELPESVFTSQEKPNLSAAGTE